MLNVSLTSDTTLLPKLAADFDRWRAKLPPGYPVAPHALSPETVLRAHYLIADHFISIGGEDEFLDVGVKDLHLFLSAIDRQHVGMGSSRKWNTLFEITATLFFGIVKNHAFHDGNKRTGLLSAIYQLSAGGRTIACEYKELDKLAVRTADNRLGDYRSFESCMGRPDSEVRFLARHSQRITRDVDRRQYWITYKQLDRLLRRFNACIVPTGSNKADVVKTVTERHGFLRRQTREMQQRVSQVGFHAWTTQVPLGVVKAVREALGLVPEKGVDSQVFFADADPMESLIAQFAGPLRRLKNR